MDYYGNNDWRDYLEHYGVKGMKWKNHKYASELKDFIDYKITGKGYLKKADRAKKDYNASTKRANKATNFGSGKGPNGVYEMRRNRWASNSYATINSSDRAFNAYKDYRNKSLVGKMQAKKGTIPSLRDYDLNSKRYNNLSEMNSTRRELKKRQRKEKAKALVDKILGRRYNSSPANSQKHLMTENIVREQFVREKKIKEKKIKEKKK